MNQHPSFHWGEFFGQMMPVFIACMIGAGVIIKFYGDSKAEQIEQIVKTENARLRESFNERLDKSRLEMTVYINEQMKGVLTKDVLSQLSIPIEDKVKFIDDRQHRLFETLIPRFQRRMEAVELTLRAHKTLKAHKERATALHQVPGYSDDLYRAPRQ